MRYTTTEEGMKRYSFKKAVKKLVNLGTDRGFAIRADQYILAERGIDVTEYTFCVGDRKGNGLETWKDGEEEHFIISPEDLEKEWYIIKTKEYKDYGSYTITLDFNRVFSLSRAVEEINHNDNVYAIRHSDYINTVENPHMFCKGVPEKGGNMENSPLLHYPEDEKKPYIFTSKDIDCNWIVLSK